MVRRTPTSLRGPPAETMREMAERHEMSLSRLLQDAILVYANHIATGYRPGTYLAGLRAQQAGQNAST
jgi:hypothetical protein